jgi:hypothetical protein
VEVSDKRILQEMFRISVKLFASLILLFLFSCKQQKSPPALYGRWILDSTSGKGGVIIAGGPRGHTEFTLRQDETFDYKLSDFDVYANYTGTYLYQKQTDTGMPLLIFSFISGVKVRKDTLGILSLNDTLLRAQETERYTLLDSTLIIQNRIKSIENADKKT